MSNFCRERERARILFVVDDEEDAKELVTRTLVEYTLTYARDFNEGLRLALLGYFDLYILDNWLPDRSGVELCRRIREFDLYTPILFYSDTACERDIEDALRAGALDYLIKPVIPAELMQAVSRLISAAGETVFEARRAESAAILEELALRQTAIAERLKRAKKKRLRAEEKLLRDKALIAFLAAGGTRGAFAREWLSGFSDEVRCDRTPLRVAIERER